MVLILLSVRPVFCVPQISPRFNFIIIIVFYCPKIAVCSICSSFSKTMNSTLIHYFLWAITFYAHFKDLVLFQTLGIGIHFWIALQYDSYREWCAFHIEKFKGILYLIHVKGFSDFHFTGLILLVTLNSVRSKI